MNKLKRISAMMMMLLMNVTMYAQETTTEPVDMMRSNGKLYVVVAVVVTILLGLFLYVYNLDKKISKLEKK